MRHGLVGLLAMLVTSIASANVTLVRIIDTDTTVPGTGETFVSFDGNIAIEGDTIVFAGAWGAEGPEQFGLFAYDGELETILDANTPIPGGEGNFTIGAFPALAGGELAFLGFQLDEDDVPTQSGIYYVANGGLELIADQNTPIPGGVGTFTLLSNVARSENLVAFRGQDYLSDQLGVYAWSGGELSVAADRNTTVPGTTASFAGFSTAAVDENEILFHGMYMVAPGDWWDGIYSTVPDLHAVVDESTPVPGGTGTFTHFSSVSADDGAIAFIGSDHWFESNRGVYTTRGGLRVVAQRDWPVPGSTATFYWFYTPVIDGDVIAFKASTGEVVGIYAEARGTLVKLIDANDMLDGRAVYSLDIGPYALDERNVVIRVRFEDDSEAIYIATICLGDLNGDGLVGPDDLIILLDNYGSTGVPVDDGDINGDGVVDLADLAILLGNYGSSCL